MILIILQGLPGCGKSAIAKKLIKKLHNSKHIKVDKFKLEALNENKTWQESQKIAYDKALSSIDNYNLKKINYVIVEELFISNEFADRINSYIKTNKITYYWFQINRPLPELLELEQQRKRKIKNSLKDFLSLQKAINKIKIKNKLNIENSINVNLDELTNHLIKIITSNG